MAKIDYKELFDGMNNAIEQTEANIKSLTASYTDFAKTVKAELTTISQNDNLTGKQIAKTDELIGSTKKLKTAKEELSAQDREVLRLKKQYETLQIKHAKLNSEENIALQKSKIAMQQRNKALKTEIQSSKVASDSIRGMELRLNALRKEYDSASASSRQKLLPELQKQTAEFKRVREESGRYQDSVGHYEKGNKILAKSFKGLSRVAGMLGFVGVLLTIANALKNVIGSVNAYEKEMSRVLAITRANKSEMRDLTKLTQDLGGSTKFTSTQVAEGVTELSKLGFTVIETKASMKAILDGAVAMDTEVSKLAEVAAIQIRAFQKSAYETTDVVDLMATSFTKSALDIDKFTESAKYVAPIANANKIPIQRMTADLAALADAGISGSQAGTALRRIYTDLAKEGGTIEEAFSSLATKGLTVSDAMDEVGRNAQTALLVLSQNQDKVKGLVSEFGNVTGATNDMANAMQGNVIGAMTELGSAWDKLMHKFLNGTEESSGWFAKISRYILSLSKDLVTSLSGEWESNIVENWSDSAESMHKSIIESMKKYNTDYGDEVDARIELREGEIEFLNADLMALENELKNKRDPFLYGARQKEIREEISLIERKINVQNNEIKKLDELYDANKKLGEQKIKDAEKAELELQQQLQRESDLKKEALKKEGAELDKIREQIRLSEIEREKQRRIIDAQNNIDDKNKLTLALYDIEKEYIDNSISLLQKRLDTEDLTNADRLNIAEEINSKIFDIEKMYHDKKIELAKKEIEEKNKQKELDSISSNLLASSQGATVTTKNAKFVDYLVGRDLFQTDDIQQFKGMLSEVQNILERQATMQRDIILQYDNDVKDLSKSMQEEAKKMANGERNRFNEMKKDYERKKQLRDKEIRDYERNVRKQMALNKLMQASEIALAIAHLYKNHAKMSVAGVVIASAQIAIMMAQFANFKNQAQKLEKGGMLEGNSHKNGGIPIFMKNGEQKYEAEGGEFVVNKKATAKTLNSIRAINDNKITDKEILGGLALYDRFNKNEILHPTINKSSQINIDNKKVVDSIEKQTKELRKEKRSIEINGNVVTLKTGSSTHRKIYK